MRKITHDDFKEKIIGLLKEHPNGMTSVEIAKSIGFHRHTVSKYIYQLSIEGSIMQREVGIAKLCYLKGENDE